MKKIINSSAKHWGLVLGEVFIIFGAVIIGKYVLEKINLSLGSLLIALPAIFIGLVMKSYFDVKIEKKDDKKL